MQDKVNNVYDLIDAPTACFQNQKSWIDPLVVTDVIWESIDPTESNKLLGYCHESQTDHIHMSKGELTFVLVKNKIEYKINLQSGDGKVLVIYPNVWHSVINNSAELGIFLNMAKRHAKPGLNDFVQTSHPLSL